MAEAKRRYTTVDGSQESGLAVLLNGPDGTLHVANLLFPASDVDLNNLSVLATSPDWGIEGVVEQSEQLAALDPIYTDGHTAASLLV